MTLDRILAITSLSLTSLVLGVQILGYFKPHLTSRPDERYAASNHVHNSVVQHTHADDDGKVTINQGAEQVSVS